VAQWAAGPDALVRMSIGDCCHNGASMSDLCAYDGAIMMVAQWAAGVPVLNGALTSTSVHDMVA